MPDFKEYKKHGIYIAYPENWRLEEVSMDSPNGSLSLNSPQGAFWILKVHPHETDPQEIASEVIKLMREQNGELEFEPLEKFEFEFAITGYEMNFYYLDWISTAKIACFRTKKSTYGIFWQSGDQMIVSRGDDQPLSSETVLDAITHTVLRHFGNHV